MRTSFFLSLITALTILVIPAKAEWISPADYQQMLGSGIDVDWWQEGNGYQVTWTFGHLCELKEPDDYTPMWKRWSLSALPMIPQRFGIKLINDEGIKRQFGIIERLMQAADSIINCGDAGQEGELIQR